MAKYCNRCGETPASLREYEDYKGNKASFYHYDDCATQAYRYFRQETRHHEQVQEEAKKKKQKVEEVRKKQEWKLSHCQQCGKKPGIYHYIYDKRTGKLISSTRNANDADNQIVFCAKEHFQLWLNKHKAKITEILKKEGKRIEEENEKLEELLVEQEELLKLLAEELEKENSIIICAKCGQNKKGKHWINGQDQNTFCSESCYDDYYAENKCDECDLEINGKSYYNDFENKTGTLCQNCSEKKILANLRKKPDSSSPLPSNSPNYSPLNNSPPTSSQNNQSDIKCYNCKKYFNYGDNTHYFSQKPDKKWCDSCDPEIKICLDTTQKIFQNQEVNVDNLNISVENKEQLKALVKIKKGEQINIDELNIDNESKKELKEIQEQLETNPSNESQKRSKNTSNYVVKCLDCGIEYETDKDKEVHSDCWYCKSKNIQVWKNGSLQENNLNSKPNDQSSLPWIVGGAMFILLLIPYLLWRQKKVKKMKKKGQKIPWWF